MNAQRFTNQVGTRSRESQTSVGGGGSEPAVPSRESLAARAIKQGSRRGGERNVLALAADARRDGHAGSAPPGAEAPAGSVWDSRERVPTWFLGGCAAGAARFAFSTS